MFTLRPSKSQRVITDRIVARYAGDARRKIAKDFRIVMNALSNPSEDFIRVALTSSFFARTILYSFLFLSNVSVLTFLGLLPIVVIEVYLLTHNLDLYKDF
jgi:hypothetical protein